MESQAPGSLQCLHAPLSQEDDEKMTHTEQYLKETAEIAGLIPAEQVEKLVAELKALRDRGGRLFLVGLGGSAANCSHAVSDFRRLCGIDAYTPVDNVAELTARINDLGWEDALLAGQWRQEDALFVLSVGGGTPDVSLPILIAIRVAQQIPMRVFGIVGRDGGCTKEFGHSVVVIPTVNPSRVTPHTEAFQMVILHCLFSHPKLQQRKTVW